MSTQGQKRPGRGGAGAKSKSKADVKNSTANPSKKTSVGKGAARQDRDDAEMFLSAIDDTAETFTFQTFTDHTEKKNGSKDPLERIFHGSLDESWTALCQLNNSGAGVYVTINETNFEGRRAEHITRTRAVFEEQDTIGKAPADYPLLPHLEVESSPGKFHRYWLVDGLSLDEWEGVQASIAERFESDSSAANGVNRVMRLPGFFHQKNPDNPHIVRLVEVNPEQAYTPEQIRAAFPPIPRADANPKPELGLDHSEVLQELEARGHLIAQRRGGGWNILCPWHDEHTTGNDGTVYFEPCTGGYAGHGFKCQHAHCQDKTADDLLEWLGIASEIAPTGKKSMATQLVELAESLILFNCDDEAYANLRINGHRETWPLRSKHFRDYMTRWFYLEQKRTPNATAMEDALRALSGKACYEGETSEVFTRIGEHQNNIFLDLCDARWRAVQVNADGWRIIDEPPVHFVRRKGQLPMPEPVQGGNATKIFDYLNITHEDERPLVLAWLVQALRPRGPYPIVILNGEQGAAKTTAARVLAKLIDPRKAATRTPPRTEQDLLIAAENGWVVSFDNLSYLHDWLSDALCRLATGGGFSTRELYTDKDEVLIDVSRPVILNGIEDVVVRPDLLDRSLTLTLAPIHDDDRMAESEFWSRFNNDAGCILGGLLDGVVEAMRNEPKVRLKSRPRMADFAIWATAAETAFKYKRGDFMKAYDAKRQDAVRANLESSAVAIAINVLMEHRPEWSGTMGNLLSELNTIAENKNIKTKYWPAMPRGLGNSLRRLATPFRSTGMCITISDRHQRDGVRVDIVNKNYKGPKPGRY